MMFIITIGGMYIDNNVLLTLHRSLAGQFTRSQAQDICDLIIEQNIGIPYIEKFSQLSYVIDLARRNW